MMFGGTHKKEPPTVVDHMVDLAVYRGELPGYKPKHRWSGQACKDYNCQHTYVEGCYNATTIDLWGVED
jgi:hypothetical protein